MKRTGVWGCIAAVIISVSLVALYVATRPDTLSVNGHTFRISIAESDEDKIRGLSGTARLDPQSGMLFAFNNNDRHGIWMKDMNYPIDIIWLDSDKKIVDIQTNIHPDTYPKVFKPRADARYVLELAAGETRKYEIQQGQAADF